MPPGCAPTCAKAGPATNNSAATKSIRFIIGVPLIFISHVVPNTKPSTSVNQAPLGTWRGPSLWDRHGLIGVAEQSRYPRFRAGLTEIPDVPDLLDEELALKGAVVAKASG